MKKLFTITALLFVGIVIGVIVAGLISRSHRVSTEGVTITQ